MFTYFNEFKFNQRTVFIGWDFEVQVELHYYVWT